MPKRRIFLAYCSAKEELAFRLKKALDHDFEVVLWQEAHWSGGMLFDSIVREIETCHLGIAVLSCDDYVKRPDRSHWAARDNVILELGFFLSHFGKHRTAVISVSEADGSSPHMPTDLQGWFHLSIDANPNKPKIDYVTDRIRSRFSAKEAQVLLSLVPHGTARRGFNVLSTEDVREHWGKLQGKFYCLNPSWTMEEKDPMWMNLHVQRYASEHFHEANYVVDIDRGMNCATFEGPSNGKNRMVDDNRDLRGIARFVKELVRVNPGIAEQLEAKMRVYVRPGVRSEMTAFLSQTEGEERAFLFVRRLTENTVLEARSPEYVGRIREHINVFMAKRHYFRPSQLETLCHQMVGH